LIFPEFLNCLLYQNIPVFKSTWQMLADYDKVKNEFQYCNRKSMKDLNPDYWYEKAFDSQRNIISASYHMISDNKKL